MEKRPNVLFPDRADAQSWTTRDCFDRIRPDEYDNRFSVSGLLKEGENEILVVYETWACTWLLPDGGAGRYPAKLGFP